MSTYIPTLDEVFKLCCEYFNTDYHIAISRGRLKENVKVRQYFAYISLTHYGYSNNEISKYLNKLHSTVSQGIKKYHFFYDNYADCKKIVDELKQLSNERFDRDILRD